MFRPPQALSTYKWIRQKGIQANLSRRCNRLFLPIHDMLSNDVEPIHECKLISERLNLFSIQIWATKKGEIQEVLRLPVFVWPDVAKIAKRLRVSAQLVRLYLKGMTDSGFIIRTSKEPVPRPRAAYLVLGGWYEGEYTDKDKQIREFFTSAYFVNENAPGIKAKLRTWERPKKFKSEIEKV